MILSTRSSSDVAGDELIITLGVGIGVVGVGIGDVGVADTNRADLALAERADSPGLFSPDSTCPHRRQVHLHVVPVVPW